MSSRTFHLYATWFDQSAAEAGTHVTAARDQVFAARLQLLPNALQHRDPVPRILVCLKDRLKACISNTFGEIV